MLAIERNDTHQSSPRGPAPHSLPPIPPAWSMAGVDRSVLAGRINQGNLEAMQWLAFVAMVIDHVGFLMPRLTAGAVAEVMWMRGIGRLAAPIFCLVFSWRLAHLLWRNPNHDFMAMGFRLAACTMAAEIAWRLMVPPHWPVNIVAGFLGAMVVVVLMQEDRGWAAPRTGRWALSALIAWWVVTQVDYGFMGLMMTLGLYGFFRYADLYCRNVALAALVLMPLGYLGDLGHLGYSPKTAMVAMSAIVALPVVVIVHMLGWTVKKPIPWLFYWLYPAHVAVLGAIVLAMKGP